MSVLTAGERLNVKHGKHAWSRFSPATPFSLMAWKEFQCGQAYMCAFRSALESRVAS